MGAAHPLGALLVIVKRSWAKPTRRGIAAMRHRNRGRKLSRTTEHRWALFRNLATSLFAHERISTTLAKAKELRPFAEKLITIAKRGSASLERVKEDASDTKAVGDALTHRRRLMALLGGKKKVIVGSEEVNVIDKLLKEIGPRFKDRPGGYTRIVKRTHRRLGDAAPTAYIELLSSDQGKPKEKSQAIPAQPEPREEGAKAES